MWRVGITVTLVPAGDGLRDIVIDAYEGFRGLDGVIAPDLGGTLGDGTLTFSMVSSAVERVAALNGGCAAVRTALHAAGVHTPGWEQLVEDALDRAKTTVEPASAPEDLVPA